MYQGKQIGIVIPALNEEHQIGKVLDALPEFVDVVMVIDDGSIDKTAEIARNRGAIVYSHEKNEGVGQAFQSGLRLAIKADVDIMVNIDADGQFNPADIQKLIQPIVEKTADFVTASRFKNPEFYPTMSTIKFYGNLFMSFLISKVVGRQFYDVSCGFRAYSKEAMRKINLFGEFTYTHETFIDLAFKKISILEVPLVVRGTREHGKSRVASNLFKYGYQTLKIILKTLRDYKPFSFFGFVSLVFLIVGIILGAFFLFHYWQTGVFSPHKWAGFTSGFCFILSSLFIVMGFVMDMFARMRRNQEEMLFYLKDYYAKNQDPKNKVKEPLSRDL